MAIGTGGGGGGAGAAGSNATSGVGGAGGVGNVSSLSGASVTYGSGGGGGAASGTGGAAGGTGAGAGSASSAGSAASANTGAGGGGGGPTSAGGAGGSGIIILTYAGAQQLTAGDYSYVNGNSIHTVTANTTATYGLPTITWVTAAGNIGNIYTGTTYANAATVVATVSAGTVSYSVTSGALPSGLSLGSANGVIYGTTANVVATSTFTVTANTTASGTGVARSFSLTTSPPGVSTTYVLVAGGGSGGYSTNGGNRGAGGGAGGLVTGTTLLTLANTYTVVVGAGAAAGSGTNQNNGGNTTFTGLTTAVGGGGGGYQCGPGSVTGANGGSGGGGVSQSGTGSTAAGTGTVGQGYAGAAGSNSSGQPYGQGGGGGAGGAGSLSNNPAGAGGVGLANPIAGSTAGQLVSSTYYLAGGGGGGTYGASGGAGGAGGNGGGGAGGGGSTGALPVNGTASTGGGGGGAEYNSARGSSGGSGIVILSYVGAQQFGGGVVTSAGGNTIHTFTTSGTLTPLSSLTASYLIVAGGAGGGNNNGGGGGAGGYLTGSGLTIDTNSTYVVTVGAGGIGNSTNGGTGGTSGGNSVFSAYATAAVGGGGGAGQLTGTGTPTGLSGGSGGGGTGGEQGTYTGGSAGGSSTSGQGNAGGTGANTNAQANRAGGGGGGAGAVGGNGSTSSSSAISGAGGIGVASSISGTSTYYAGGGGGGAQADTGSASGGAGGNGGGGNGAVVTAGQVLIQASTAGTANTGGGGGGQGRSANSSGQNGGSGIVIVSYPGSTAQMAGGTVTITGGNVIHTFTSSGYLSPIRLVTNSLRFRSSASAYLNRTPPVAGNQKTWTWSAWVKRGVLGATEVLFHAYDGSASRRAQFYFNTSDQFVMNQGGDGSSGVGTSSAVFRDPAAWYHIMLVANYSSSAFTFYVNGVAQAMTYSTAISNQNGQINGAWAHSIASQATGQYFDGEMTEVNFIDGQALSPTAFGASNQYGTWQPIVYGGSYGTNGFYLPFTGSASYTGSFNGSSQSLLAAGATNVSFAGDFTFEYWFYPTNSSGTDQGGGLSYRNSGFGTGGFQTKYNGTTGVLQWIFNGGGTTVTSTGISNNKWNHIAVVRSGTTVTAYTNGTATSSATGFSTTVNGGTSNFGIYIGNSYDGNNYYAQGYLSNLRMAAVAVYATSFNPPTSALTAITGTQLLTLQNATIVDNSTNAFSLTNTGSVTTSQSFPFVVSVAQDYSPVNNNWSVNGFGSQLTTNIDNMTDVPTLTSATAANYCVLNAVNKGTNINLTNGNLQYDNVTADASVFGTIGMSSGKFYWEMTVTSAGCSCGIAAGALPSGAPGSSATGYAYNYDGRKVNNSSLTSYGASYTVGDVIGFAFDADAGTITCYKNNTSQGTMFSGLTSGPYFAAAGNGGSGAAYNFGQQPFRYTAPSGFVALNTYNM
jgi:Concanavalin A-like lectin/glucanases superfamily/SPRY domain